jgi:hypothetical protein
MQDNNMMKQTHCTCMCGQRKTVDMASILNQLQELVYVMEAGYSEDALNRLKFIVTTHGGSLEDDKI